MKQLPNVLTLSRIVLIILSLGWTDEVLWLAFVAFYVWMSDHFDGILARRLQSTSAIGATLDHVSDKFASIFFLVLMVQKEMVPFWFAFTLLGRDALSDMLKTMAITTGRKLPVSWVATWKTGLLFLWCGGYFLSVGTLGSEPSGGVHILIMTVQYLILGMSISSLIAYGRSYWQQKASREI
jgi:phosphatidylglycerophosphate synthase